MYRMTFEHNDKTEDEIAELREIWGAASAAEVLRRAVALAAAISKRGVLVTITDSSGVKTDVVLV